MEGYAPWGGIPKEKRVASVCEQKSRLSDLANHKGDKKIEDAVQLFRCFCVPGSTEVSTQVFFRLLYTLQKKHLDCRAGGLGAEGGAGLGEGGGIAGAFAGQGR